MSGDRRTSTFISGIVDVIMIYVIVTFTAISKHNYQLYRELSSTLRQEPDQAN